MKPKRLSSADYAAVDHLSQRDAAKALGVSNVSVCKSRQRRKDWPSQREVVAEFERREKAAGGIGVADIGQIVVAMANHYDCTGDHIRSLLLDAWNTLRSG